MLNNFYLPTLYSQDKVGNVQKLINSLLNEKVPAIVLKQFFNSKQCKTVISKCWEHNFFWLKESILGRIGATLAQFHSQEDGEERYFEISEQVNTVLKWLFAETGSPLETLTNLLYPYYEISVAYDSSLHRHYAAGMIQAQLNQGKVHTDKVSYETSHWSIGQLVKKQFSSVLYLQLPDSGGSLEVYNRQWQENDIELAFSPNPRIRLGVDECIVRGCEKIVYQPELGDMLLLNTSFYHRVMQSEGENHRIAAMSFLGVTEDSRIVYFM